MQSTLANRGAALSLPSSGRRQQPTRARGTLAVRSLAVPDQYGYVMASAAFGAAVVQWQAIRVAIARRDAGVSYPAMYAEGTGEAAQKFNCTQRAHLNTTEVVGQALALQCLLGLAYPTAAAALGATWAVGRIVYTLGYSTGDPSKRGPGGAVSGLAFIALILATLVTGVRTGAGI